MVNGCHDMMFNSGMNLCFGTSNWRESIGGLGLFADAFVEKDQTNENGSKVDDIEGSTGNAPNLSTIQTTVFLA